MKFWLQMLLQEKVPMADRVFPRSRRTVIEVMETSRDQNVRKQCDRTQHQ